MRIVSVVGARPNLVKMAPVVAQLRRALPEGAHVLVDTGQHYDRLLFGTVLEELGMPQPDHRLGVGSGSHAVQTARVLERLEPVLQSLCPDLVIVAGDVNSTLATALVAAKLGIPIAHVESGLRSYDRTMPEEINRVVVDHLSTHLFVHSADAVENLIAEGAAPEKIDFVGNTMIDSLVAVEDRFRERAVAARLGLSAGDFVVVTLHRPALVDGPLLAQAIDQLIALAQVVPVVFPMHPRARHAIESMPEASRAGPGLQLLEPLGYLDFLSLEADAAAVLSDSGGVQEETTFLGVPCFTLRDNTERPVTITHGTNRVLGLDPARIAELPVALASWDGRGSRRPPKWDGHAAERLVARLLGGASSEPSPVSASASGDRAIVGASASRS